MSRFSRQHEQRCAELLADGEEFLAAVRAKPKWAVSAAVSGAGGASPDRADSPAARKQRKEIADAESVGFPYPKSCALALTDRRIIVHERSAAFGTVKEHVGDVALTDIQEVRVSDEKGLGDRFRFVMPGDVHVDLYARKKDDSAVFRALLEQAMGSAGS